MSFKSFSTAHGAAPKGPFVNQPPGTKAAVTGNAETNIPKTKAAPPVTPLQKS